MSYRLEYEKRKSISQKRKHTEATSNLNNSPKSGVPLFLQRSMNNNSNNTKTETPVDIEHAKFNGSPLPKQSRQEFESIFNTDLSDVRIHSDEKHQQLAKSLNAKAFTTGSDIVFAKGRYSPGSVAGKKLLSHELTHVVQQRSVNVEGDLLSPDIRLSRADSKHEKQADLIADGIDGNRKISEGNMLSKSLVSNQLLTSQTIQRDEDEENENGFNYGIFPPSLGYRSGPYSLSANSSTARMGLDMGGGNLSLGYNYGDPHSFPPMWGDFRNRFGADSPAGNFFLSGAFGDFYAGVGTNFRDSFSAGIGYGAPLLPMPNVFAAEAGAAWPAAYGVAGALPSFPQDPLAAYAAQRDNIGSLSAMGSSVSDIINQQQAGGMQFGVGAQFMMDPLTRYRFNFGLQGAF